MNARNFMKEVWKEPVIVVAKRYGVSEVALAKACRKLAVPLPPRGYWARVRAGPQIPRVCPCRLTRDRRGIQASRRARVGSADTAAGKGPDKKLEDGSTTSTVPEPSDGAFRTGKEDCNGKGGPKKTLKEGIPGIPLLHHR